MRLVINTNSNLCRMYLYTKHPAQLTLIKELSHPENKLKSRDLTADKQGHYKAGNTARGAFSPHTDAKDVKIESFSREIATLLNQERNNNAYEQLIIIAPPPMNGLLFKHINKHVRDLVVNNIEKDLFHLADHELLTFLQTHTQYRDG